MGSMAQSAMGSMAPTAMMGAMGGLTEAEKEIKKLEQDMLALQREIDGNNASAVTGGCGMQQMQMQLALQGAVAGNGWAGASQGGGWQANAGMQGFQQGGKPGRVLKKVKLCTYFQK